MKIREILPQVPKYMENEARLASLANFMEIAKSGETYRPPTLGADTSFVNSWLRQQMAFRQQMINDLLVLAMTIEEIRGPLEHISSEVFRKGIQWKPKFAVKCNQCSTEYNDSQETCKKCGAQDFREPDETQKERPEEFLDDCNIWDQSLEEVLRDFHFDLNAVDDAYLYLVKEYLKATPDKKVRSKLIEIRKLDPSSVEILTDNDGLPKNSNFFCYIHRDINPELTQGRCGGISEDTGEVCGLEKVPAMYKYKHRGKEVYLLDSEVIHLKKFHTSETYGWSPILTIFEKAMTIKGMDSFLYKYFFERKMPSSMIMVFTDDPESLRRERENIQARLKIDPHYVPMVAVSARQNRGRVDMVRLFHTLQEMDYLPVRQEIRERIASMWGVSPIWQGAPEAFGGLSQQTQQLVVTSRVVESDQRMFHEKVLPQVLEAFGVTDWEWELPQPEEKAEATRLSFAQQKISAANMLFQMGFDVKIKSAETGIADIDFVISGEAKKPDMFGGFGGMPPAIGGAPAEAPPEEEGSAEQPQEPSMAGQPMQNPGAPVSLMQKAVNRIDLIMKAGHPFPVVKHAETDSVFFESAGAPFVAKFNPLGKLVSIEKFVPSRMHQHGIYPPHDVNQPHKDNPAAPKESSIFDADEPEEGM